MVERMTKMNREKKRSGVARSVNLSMWQCGCEEEGYKKKKRKFGRVCAVNVCLDLSQVYLGCFWKSCSYIVGAGG